jgi:HD superfamily phosphodiesterase
MRINERARRSIDDRLFDELDALVRDTYQLWDHEWVGFSWRNYTYDHVHRVRWLALSLAADEGADTRPLDVAALLHDITKSYDGEIVMRDGARVLDEQGFWRNAFLPPAHANHATDLYRFLDLAGTLHSESGACVADALLAERGYDPAFRAHVGEIIRSHLRVTEASSPEGRCLYDADTIDANIGHPALYRNIQISMHLLEQQLAADGATLGAFLDGNLHAYLEEMVCRKWPDWVDGKLHTFVDRMTTDAGRRRALARIERIRASLAVMQDEMRDVGTALVDGYLAPIAAFMRGSRNPVMPDELAQLEARWPAGSGCPAARLLETLRRESAGDW